MSSIVVSGDTSGAVTLDAPTVAGTVTVTLPAASGTMVVTGSSPSLANVTATGNLSVSGNTTLGDASTDTVLMTGAPSIGGAGYGMGMGFRNRIINGDMRIDQRFAGAANNATGGAYVVDRWNHYHSGATYSTQQSTTVPSGFYNSLLMTNTTASASPTYCFFGYKIEGYNIADLDWGLSTAKPVTISFWVRSSVTGVYSISVVNDNADRSYPAQYTINSVNTFEYKTITIPGCTDGTWLKTNGIGLYLRFNLGSPSGRLATSGSWQNGNYDGATGSTGASTWANTLSATFYITGVQLEKGSVASAFEQLQYGHVLALCQRYFFTTYSAGVALGSVSQPNARTCYAFDASTLTRAWFVNGAFPVPMRTTPTTTIYDQSTGASGYVREYSSAVQRAVSSINNGGQNGDQGMFGYMLLATNGSQIPQQFHLGCSAEL
jgi:hypothetical protein